MSFIKLPISLFSFFLFFPLQSSCMVYGAIIDHVKATNEIPILWTDRTHIKFGLICKSHYQQLNNTSLPSVELYMKTLIHFSRNNDTENFNRFIKETRPFIKKEIQNIQDELNESEKTKDLPLITVFAKNQHDENNPHPFQRYNFPGILRIILKANPSLANLIFYQGYPSASFIENSSARNLTLMHRAALWGNIETLNIAIKICPSSLINARSDDDGYTPIGCAIANHSSAGIIEKLIQHYSESIINEPCDPFLNTPLILAIQNRNIEAIKILLNHPKINLNIKNKANLTALNIAQENASITKQWISQTSEHQQYEEIIKLLENKMQQSNI